MKSFSAHDLCLAAVMTTLVFLATFIPKIPIPLGYAHLGDAAIFLMVYFLPRRIALFSACVGSAFSDLLGGFLLWVLPTLVIKFIMAEILRHFIHGKWISAAKLRLIIGMLLASLWMAAAYTFFGAVLYDSMAAGLASAPGLLLEGAVNTVVALVLFPVLKHAFTYTK